MTVEAWETVEVVEVLEPWHSRLGRRGFEVDCNDVMSLILVSGQAQAALRVAEEPGEPDDGALRQFVPRTRLFFNRPKAVDLGWDAITAAGVYLMTGSASLASGLTMLRRTVQTFRHLSLEEMDVVLVMRAICGTRDHHRTTVTEDELRAVYEDSPVPRTPTVASLVKKVVVVEVDGGWRLVP